MFSDFPENDLGNLEEEGSLMINNGQGGRVGDELIIEEENEKRKLEQIYMVAGEEKKTHISLVELYGFFSWNLSAVFFVLYMIWAFVPDHIL